MLSFQQIGGLDLAIVLGYFVFVIIMGLWVHKMATKDRESYFLAGRNLPWWMLGLSGCSSYIDIGGTMGMIGLLYYLGFQGVWVTHIFWGWLIIAGYMAFQAKWIRRSGVMTFAEWNVTRFGEGKDTDRARLTAATFLLVLMLANLTYIAVGIGKFAPIYLPFDRTTCTILILGVTGVYVTLGGFFGVIFTDILQTVLIVIGAIVLTVMALNQAGPETWQVARPDWWWDTLPHWNPNVAAIGGQGYYRQFESMGPILIGGGVWLIARVLAGPNVWDFQFFLSARSPRDAAMAGGVWTVGYTFRWFLATALLAFGLAWFGKEADFDSENIMPRVIAGLAPGLKGALLAILFAAFMSTFDAMINVTSNVVVNDFFRRYFTKNLSEKGLVRLGQLFSIIFLALAAFLSLSFNNVNEIWEAMIFSVVTAILVPSMLRWHWGGFTAHGFTWGVIATGGACLADVITRALVPGFPPQYATLPFIIILSLVICVVITKLGPETPLQSRVTFYANVRPFGFWRRERQEAIKQGLVPARDKTPMIDLINGFLVAAFQVSLCLIPFNLILRRPKGFAMACVSAAALGLTLFFTWFRTLPKRVEKL